MTTSRGQLPSQPVQQAVPGPLSPGGLTARFGALVLSADRARLPWPGGPMETRNYYVVLGVDPMESTHGIRSAFRELVQRYHPDRAGSRGMPFFQDIIAAYRVLSDPERRASYDAGLRDAGAGTVHPRMPITPAPWPQPEPLSPVPISLFRDFAVRKPGIEE